MATTGKKHILAIGAHVGDVENTAGLLLTKYAMAGHRASIVHMTAGEKGHPPGVDHRTYRAQRLREARPQRRSSGPRTASSSTTPTGSST